MALVVLYLCVSFIEKSWSYFVYFLTGFIRRIYIFGTSFAIMSLPMSKYKLLHLFYRTSSENFILMKLFVLNIFSMSGLLVGFGQLF